MCWMLLVMFAVRWLAVKVSPRLHTSASTELCQPSWRTPCDLSPIFLDDDVFVHHQSQHLPYHRHDYGPLAIELKNVEQSATGSDCITSAVIIQVSTENLFVFHIMSWPLIQYYSGCKVTAVLMHYPHKINCMHVNVLCVICLSYLAFMCSVCQLSHLAVWGSIMSWFLFLAVYPYMWPTIDLAPEMVGMVCRDRYLTLFMISLWQ